MFRGLVGVSGQNRPSSGTSRPDTGNTSIGMLCQSAHCSGLKSRNGLVRCAALRADYAHLVDGQVDIPGSLPEAMRSATSLVSRKPTFTTT